MKRVFIVILAACVCLGITGISIAGASTVTLDSRGNACTDFNTCFTSAVPPTDVLKVSFDAGLYNVSVPTLFSDAGAWQTFTQGATNLAPPNLWLWYMNIYEPSTGNQFVLGDDSNAYNSGSNAHAAVAGQSVLINHASAGELWFYVKDSTAQDNTGTITADISVAPEPVSTVLFITGGGLMAVRRYFRA